MKKKYLEVKEKMGVTLRLRVTNKEGKETVSSVVTDQVEKRISRKPKGAIQLVWTQDRLGRRLVHIHCKANGCGNEWKIEEGVDPSQKFEVQQLEGTLWRIRCIVCGTEFTSG